MRASPRGRPGQKRETSCVLCTNTKEPRERERARTRNISWTRGRELQRVHVTRNTLKNIFRVCSMGANGKRVNECSVET